MQKTQKNEQTKKTKKNKQKKNIMFYIKKTIAFIFELDGRFATVKQMVFVTFLRFLHFRTRILSKSATCLAKNDS